MQDTHFVYRIPGRSNGQRPGAHQASTTGTGNQFSAHARLFDVPDPRRLDLRASLRSGREEWLVRTYRQRAAIPLYAVVDISPSMQIGSPKTKAALSADFVEMMGDSAFQAGDAAGLVAFDGQARPDRFLPAMHRRGGARMMKEAILSAEPMHRQGCGLVEALRVLAGREALVFLVSDFHWPLDDVAHALDLLERAWVVPLIIWDRSETDPPDTDGFIQLRDSEGSGVRPIWLNAKLRRQWRANIDARRHALDTLFSSRQIRPHYIQDSVFPERLSHYFLELGA